MRHANWFKGLGWRHGLLAAVVLAITGADLSAFTINVQDRNGSPVSGFRWLVEEDNTNQKPPGIRVHDSIGVDIHKSYAPVVASGHSGGSSANVDLPSDQRYMVSVLPDADYALSGANVGVGQAEVAVIVTAHPTPTAQISVFVFNDNYSINNAPDIGNEVGLEGFTIVLADAGGHQMMDAFGNMLGTTYRQNADGTFQLDGDGNPIVEMAGQGYVLTDENGEAVIKYIPPGKFGVRAIPPAGGKWVQTATIEGTPTIDAWVKANEPEIFVEGFGTGFYHVFIGFVNREEFPWAISPPSGGGSISGRIVTNHFSRPPYLQGFFPGPPVSEAWVGLNDPLSGQGLYVAPCNDDSTFTIANVPPGTYQLVHWDKPLDQLFGFATVTVPPGDGGAGEAVELGDVLSYRWFGTVKGKVFYDELENGFPDDGEPGIPEQMVNIRFRDGSIYQFQPTDMMGEYELSEVFPFFKWLVMEVDFARFKATGMTTVIDYGGAIPTDLGWDMPSDGVLNPQPQAEDNPNTNNNLSRTETGEVLTQAMHVFLSQTNIIHWAKRHYEPGENGGISGIVYYAVTRAEDDPRFAAAEPWEPGIPRVQVNLYADFDHDQEIDDLDDDGEPTLADVDNHPFGWAEGGDKGPEDIDRDDDGEFDPGDALQITTTDSWDDSMPTGSIQDLPVINGIPVRNGFDNFGTWNQVRPGVFDGGYAFTSFVPGGIFTEAEEVEGLPSGCYIVEAVPPPFYEIIKEEDKNVDFGDPYTPSTQLLPPICVGDWHEVPDELVLFPGVPSPFAREMRRLSDRKQVIVRDGFNAAADFFCCTQVPKAARAVGFVNNDLAAEFDPNSPIYGEKSAPAWIPVSFQDWQGTELVRVYTDEFGAYNALLPSSFTMYIPAPSGVSPGMFTLVLNEPLMTDPLDPSRKIIDPFYDPTYSVTPWTFNYTPGKVTYLDTPLVAVAAFAGYPKSPLDVEPPDGTPMILSVETSRGGPVVCQPTDVVSIRSPGVMDVPNPDYDPTDPGSSTTVPRDYSFGAAGTVTVGGEPLNVQLWTPTLIEALVPAGVETGQLVVSREDSGLSTPIGVTLHIGVCGQIVLYVKEGKSIQAAIDAVPPGSLIVLGPGTHTGNLIMWKPVKIQGCGALSTTLYCNPKPPERLAAWHAKIQAILGLTDGTDPFTANEAPGIMVLGNAGHTFTEGDSLIDGVTILGALAGGGIYVNNDAQFLEISNTRIKGNQGIRGGGVTIGSPDIAGPANNNDIYLHHNMIVQNGGVQGPGGVAIYTGADRYRVEDSIIAGNFSRFSGGGLGHIGLSDGGVIARNRITFNEAFYGTLLAGAGYGGGLYLTGEVLPGALSQGTGSILVDSNLIQGNLAGAASGGGIRAVAINGQDVEASADPNDWYSLHLINNMIINNVAGHAGGGISILDCAKAVIVHNTIARNDSTATAALAFEPGSLVSTPQGAGLVVEPHTILLAAVSGQQFCNPILADNILWQNRSFYNDGTLNGGRGGLLPNPAREFWDIQVSYMPGASLDPRSCILTDTAGYHASNISADPQFALDYVNDLVTAAVLDEGGNYITVRYTPLQVGAGNYHLAFGSPAIGAADPAYLAQHPGLLRDYDGQTRPADGAPEIGADEYAVALPGDLNYDNRVDWTDYFIFSGKYHNGGGRRAKASYSPCDLNGDGQVDYADLTVLMDHLRP